MFDSFKHYVPILATFDENKYELAPATEVKEVEYPPFSKPTSEKPSHEENYSTASGSERHSIDNEERPTQAQLKNTFNANLKKIQEYRVPKVSVQNRIVPIRQ